jgi:hypothetical protein
MLLSSAGPTGCPNHRAALGIAEASDDSEATAEVDQSQGFTVVQFNSALNDF